MNNSLDASFSLNQRTALPDELKQYLDRYPKQDWRTHQNFRGLAARWLSIHASLRNYSNALDELINKYREQKIDAATFTRNFIPGVSQYLMSLEGHHQHETHNLFPIFVAADQRMKKGFDMLDADHEIIDQSIIQNIDSANHLIQSAQASDDVFRTAIDTHMQNHHVLSGMLTRHLDDEEDLFVPMILDYGENLY